MGNSDDGLVAELSLDRLLDQRIGIHVHIRRCLVQNQNLVQQNSVRFLLERVRCVCAFVSRTMARARESS